MGSMLQPNGSKTLINTSVSYIYFKELKLTNSILILSILSPTSLKIQNGLDEMNANNLGKQGNQRI